MRFVAGLAMIALGAAAGGAAHAQAVTGPTDTAAALAPAARAPNFDASNFDAILDRQAFGSDGRALRWSSTEVPLSARSSVRVTLGEALNAPGLPHAAVPDREMEVAVIRNWPRALSFDTGRVGIDLSPHAGLGVGNRGGSAEAGAELRLESRDDKAADRLRDLGIKDGASFGDAGRWYLFAAASGRAVGLNMLRDGADWDRAGWSTDPTSALIGDAHVGVGYRKGNVQTSFGVIHREVKGQHMVFGQETKDDTIAAFSLTIRPRK